MNTPSLDFHLSVELRSADGTSTEFYETEADRIQQTLRLLAMPRLFTQPQLVLASENCVTAIPPRTIDMIVIRTNAPLPQFLPLISPAGPLDIFEVEEDKRRYEIAPFDEEDSKDSGSIRPRVFRVETQALGGWSAVLEVHAQVRGTVLDRRRTFAHLFDARVIPFRLVAGGIGLINSENFTRATASPPPDSLPENALPMELRRWNSSRSKTLTNGLHLG